MTRHHHTCHLCHHPAADQIDHIINVKRWLRDNLPGTPHSDSNLAPVHDQPCPTCGIRCHVTKTQAEARHGRAQASRQRPTEPHPGRL